MGSELSLSVITLGVAEVTRARHFYQEVLRLGPPIEKGEVTYLRSGSIALALFPRTSLADYLGFECAGEHAAAVALSINVECKARVDEVFGVAIANGARALRHPSDASWGGYVGTFSDPDHHVWELVWNPRPFL